MSIRPCERICVKYHGNHAPDVYIAPVIAYDASAKLYPPERDMYVRSTPNEALRAQRYSTWQTLALAVKCSFGLDIDALHFEHDEHGAWTSPSLYFSLSHTDGVVAVAVSSAPVGVDIENMSVFGTRHTDDTERLAARLSNGDVNADTSAKGVLSMWTRRECAIKYGDASHADTLTLILPIEPQCVLSVCTEKEWLSAARLYRVTDGTALPLTVMP